MNENLSTNICNLKECHRQIVGRCNASWERVSTGRFLSSDSYLPDIVNPINANADRLYNIAASLAQAYDKLKRES